MVLGLIGLGAWGWWMLHRELKPSVSESPASPPTEPATVPPAEPLPPRPAELVPSTTSTHALTGVSPSTAAQPSPAPTLSPESDPAFPFWEAARSNYLAGALGAARTNAFEALRVVQSPPLHRDIETLLGQIHTALVFSPAPMEEKEDYTIQPGDTLGSIAKRFGCTLQWLIRANQLKSEVIRPGDRLRVLTGRFEVRLDKSDFELLLLLNNRFFKRYRVGVGQYDRTPTGEFQITERIPQPTWWRPDGRVIPYGDKENVLGTHWLALNVPGYGLHGTWETDTVGRAASAGCVRLLNSDIEELYLLLPVGTRVVIQD